MGLGNGAAVAAAGRLYVGSGSSKQSEKAQAHYTGLGHAWHDEKTQSGLSDWKESEAPSALGVKLRLKERKDD